MTPVAHFHRRCGAWLVSYEYRVDAYGDVVCFTTYVWLAPRRDDRRKGIGRGRPARKASSYG